MNNKIVESCLITEMCGLSYIEFHNKILKNHLFLMNVHSTQKYMKKIKNVIKLKTIK